MATDEPSLPQMLYSALTDHAKKAGFSLNEDAARYLVNQAINNINRLNDDEEGRRSDAQLAIKDDTLEKLERSVRSQTVTTNFPDRNSIVSAMKVCDGPYPWCSKVK